MSREEDEIQVLGQQPGNRPPKRRRWWRWVVVALGVVAGVMAVVSRGGISSEPSVADSSSVEVADFDLEPEVPEHRGGESRLLERRDTVNDVVLNVWELDNLQAELTVGLPDSTDAAVWMALPAADVRKDKQMILGDFVIDGQEYSFGKRKTGYVVLQNGALRLGMADTDTVKNYCLAHRASMFRQYPLVIDGQLQENQLKGKSVRRAVAQREGSSITYIVVSEARESLHDFSEALADAGFTHAIYLPGGDSFGFFRRKGRLRYLGRSMEYIFPNSSFLIFRAQ